MKKDKKKSSTRIIIEMLMKGEPLNSRDISQKMAKTDGRIIKVQNVSSTLTKISDSNRCDLGFFIERRYENNSFVYQIIKDALVLSEDQAYDLTLKAGDDRYTLDQAVNDFPLLDKYVKANTARADRKSKSKAEKRVAEKSSRSQVKTVVNKKEKNKPSVKATASEPVKIVSDNKDMEKIADQLLKKINKLGGLHFNLKVSLSFEELKD